MEMNDVKVFDDMFDSLNQGRVGNTLRLVRSYIDANPNLIYDDELDDIERDYGLMLDYVGRGYVDEHRESVYNSLLMRLNTFTCNLYLAFMIKNNAFYSDLARRAANSIFSAEQIKTRLENFVTDLAMLSLEPEETRSSKEEQLYAEHTKYMQKLFCHIIVMRQWSEAETEFYTNILLSPLVDTNDAQLIVSAITVSLVNIMDPGKFSTLMTVYKNSTDEHIRQKALVGWVFAFSTIGTALPSVKMKIIEAVKDEQVVADLVDLQKQIIFCVNAERDNKKIQDEIMPELIKNNNLKITSTSITEKDETEEDIFDPEAADRRMEKMEESFRKMMNMQKAGSDIYFGGFSQMKRFPFFYNPANWFMPFFCQHPDISHAAGKVKNTKILEHLLSNNMFCEGDKYSFAIALSSIVDKLPAAMLEMLNTKEALTLEPQPENLAPAYIRRLVLQDMYRFFKLYYPQTTDLINPFKGKNVMFIVEIPLLDEKTECAIPEINASLLDLASFMLKQKNKEGMCAVLNAYNEEENSPRYWLLHGIYMLEMEHDAVIAALYLKKANEATPNNRRILSLLARAYFENSEFLSAANTYKELYQLDESNKTVALNYSIALSKAKLYDDAASLLYKLNFENEMNNNVRRVLAWTLMGQNKLEQASREYDKLLNSDETETGDYLNAGYCHWFMNDIPQAIKLFQRFIKVSSELSKTDDIDIETEMLKDRDILSDHNIGDVDFSLMVDAVKR